MNSGNLEFLIKYINVISFNRGDTMMGLFDKIINRNKRNKDNFSDSIDLVLNYGFFYRELKGS